MAVLELPRGVALTPMGAATNRPRDDAIVIGIVMPIIVLAMVAVDVFWIGEPAFTTTDFLLSASALGFIVLGVILLPAIRPGTRGMLTANMCHRLTWATAAMILPGAVISILALVNSTWLPFGSGVFMVAMATGSSHFLSRVMRCLEARAGDYIIPGY